MSEVAKPVKVEFIESYIKGVGESSDYQWNDNHGELIRCMDCKHAVLTYDGEVKYCKFWQGEEDGSYGGDPLYLDGDFYCAAAEKKEE